MDKAKVFKMAIILFCISLTACIFDGVQTKCIDEKYYVKDCDNCQFILYKNVECLNE